jgi:hypothetical protein
MKRAKRYIIPYQVRTGTTVVHSLQYRTVPYGTVVQYRAVQYVQTVP